MNKKEQILEDIKEIYYFKPLLDYITNLQEENERLHIQLEDRAYEQIKFLYNDYKSRIDKAIDDIEHELYEHIIAGDEESWNPEYYTKGKLDYKKLLIGILKRVLKTLKRKR